MEQLSTDEKLSRLEKSLTATLSRLAMLTDEFNGVQQRLKQRITRAERQMRTAEEAQEAQEARRATLLQQQQQQQLLSVPGDVIY